MMRLTAATLLAALLFVAVAPNDATVAQDTVPTGIMLTQEASGRYRLDVDRPGSPLGEFEALAIVSAIGSDQGVIVLLASADGPRLSVVLPPVLDGISDGGCLRVNFFLRTPQTQDPFGGDGGSLNTIACIAGGVMTFPAYDGVTTPPPAPPTNVRLVPDDGDWRIAWSAGADGAADVIAYQAFVQFFDAHPDRGGIVLGSLGTPLVPKDWTMVGPLSFFGPPAPPLPADCGHARVIVYALGPDAPSLLPGNVTQPFCFDGAALTFPDTGSGSRDARASSLAALLLGAGALLIASGTARRWKWPPR